MELSVFIKRFSIIVNLVFACLCLHAQERISNVYIAPLDSGRFDIHYDLNIVSNEEANIYVRIYKRSDGIIQLIQYPAISGDLGLQRYGGNKIITWQARKGEIKNDDEVSVQIVSDLKLIKPNTPPSVEIVGEENKVVELPALSVMLTAKASDPDGQIVKIQWLKESGPNCRIIYPDHIATSVANLEAGAYLFSITVTDNRNETAKTYLNLIVKEQAAAVTSIVQNNEKPNTAPTNEPKVIQKTARLKGGPGNAFLNLLLPGVGHYCVSGDYTGSHRKGGTFLITALYLGSVGGAVYFKNQSDQNYNSYLQALQPDYQRDANGNIIGERGAQRSVTDPYYEKANNANKYFTYLAYSGAGILVTDFIWTLGKGMKNQREYNSEYKSKTSFYLIPSSTQMTAKLVFRF